MQAFPGLPMVTALTQSIGIKEHKMQKILAVLIGLSLISGCSTAPQQPAQDGMPRSNEVSTGSVWMDHMVQDILPFWTSDQALGSPAGNFPTDRSVSGLADDSTDRWPRMLGRQTFVYSLGYLMTGNPELLEYAAAGTDYLLENARAEDGTWYETISASGSPWPNTPRMAQSTAYALMGPASFFFVTRNPEAESAIIETRNLMFNPDYYWDPEDECIVDGLTMPAGSRVYLTAGGHELVAMLDQINAYMLLVQPVLSEEADRGIFLDDLELLGSRIVDLHWEDGVFWGVSSQHGNFRSRHVDFGHTLKSYWMLYNINNRLPHRPFDQLISEKYGPLGGLRLSGEYRSVVTGHGIPHRSLPLGSKLVGLRRSRPGGRPPEHGRGAVRRRAGPDSKPLAD
jgi:mannose/cellobiose epimerase-like protein (N-acyl-D-glucosamine 2-epimerase family)